ncbi:MAG: N-6 DNA methylase, partial [Candidatus Woesebacteria bacterium]|nr:N-6 DNA methylase [Candidatus Woesebacteria bacterium]
MVGRVPDPKSQVDEITTALVYKFLDDLDKQSQELGGKTKFFVDEFEKYSWSKLMDPRLGGQDRLNLYSEAITNFHRNVNLPQFFREIFKDAFLRHRSPETLNLFLKELNGFTYGHSEDLGDAFEYLLSVLNSQGDAGQFRTARHIIDFIVEIVDPKKEETILDPACGTAGFLISSYKHILKQNHNKPLTPDEKKKLMQNLVGYDISPDMVRLSRVNMYLHGFPEPKIDEYDTLTSEDKWDETFDVIMANPPFMTPKGGIRPHLRFSVKVNRSEILFVDYIIDHINARGRAGIIVPVGVVFQNKETYRQIRKRLVDENLLWAVATLPGGVFNPYSDAETSILFVDKKLASRTDNILFLTIKNDGYSLGNTREKIDEDDIPNVSKQLVDYKDKLSNGDSFNIDNGYSKLVKKDDIRANNYLLVGDRYGLSSNSYKNNLVQLGSILKRN